MRPRATPSPVKWRNSGWANNSAASPGLDSEAARNTRCNSGRSAATAVRMVVAGPAGPVMVAVQHRPVLWSPKGIVVLLGGADPHRATPGQAAIRTAALSSALSVVRPSDLRANAEAAGCTHTTNMSRPWASWPSTGHWWPFGSHGQRHADEPGPGTGTAQQPDPAPPPGPTPGPGTWAGPGRGVVLGHHDHLLALGQVDPDDQRC